MTPDERQALREKHNSMGGEYPCRGQCANSDPKRCDVIKVLDELD